MLPICYRVVIFKERKENKERNKNYKYIGIELTEEYLPISKARIEYVCNLIEEDTSLTFKIEGYKPIIDGSQRDFRNG